MSICCFSQIVCAKNPSLFLEPGNLWRPSGDKCTCYECEPGTLMVIKKVVVCPEESSVTCEEGTFVEFTSSDKCCKTPICVRDTCSLKTTWMIIEHQGCAANVSLTHCEGLCSSTSSYSTFSKNMEHGCSCCQESSISIENIRLQCKDGTSIDYSYTDVKQCRCHKTDCVPLE
ncbi:Hypothetical predicted protein [Pelobates cultripes]|uniref:CTCK domain-containing protein n=1 Tax=Pelobates cultripes TaxID=61616 RepID=A0AAD1WVN3_PELCU|nr:Hypothetical predicted protein [Pelobates cultripes]